MIDIHSHILPGLDDGSASLEESVEMLKIAMEGGTTEIVATPHANGEFRFEPEAIAEKVAELSAAVPNIRIYTGCDFHLAYENIQDALAHPARYTINQKSYLLVEFSDLIIFHTTDEIFGQLLGAGMIPVVTHPERNALLQQRLKDLGQWVEQGACLQVTAMSLMGRFGRRAQEFSERLLKEGLVHFIASDAHDKKNRTPDLKAAYEHVARKYGKRRAEDLFVKNPGNAVRGEPLASAEAEEPAEPRKWYRFWS
jgi:protein-tyrosine phosphatase